MHDYAVPGPLLAVDTPSLLYRAFFALPKSIVRPDNGESVNALLGTANLLLQAVDNYSPRAVMLCFDEEAAHYRKDLYPPYHEAREEMPEKLVPQWEDAPKFFEAFGWPSLRHDTLEADDLLGSFATAEMKADGDTLIFSGDRDMFQCCGTRTSVLYPGAKGGPTLVDTKGVVERYGVRPEQVPDFIALRGDPSDGLPGAKGIGEKGAGELLRKYGNLEDLIAAADEQKPRVAAALTEQADELRAFRQIALLQPVEVELPPDGPLQVEGAIEAAKERGMNRLAERLAER